MLTLEIMVAIVALIWLSAPVITLLLCSKLENVRQIASSNPDHWPKLSIIIPACNEGDTIRTPLRKIMGMEYPNLEVLVVNDRSTDNTEQEYHNKTLMNIYLDNKSCMEQDLNIINQVV